MPTLVAGVHIVVGDNWHDLTPAQYMYLQAQRTCSFPRTCYLVSSGFHGNDTQGFG